MKKLILFIFFGNCIVLYSQTVSLPVHFEGGSVVNGSFTNFDGGTGTVIANPVPGGINTSATVGQITRCSPGQNWAGAFLTTTVVIDLSVNPIICMMVYSSKPAGTRIALKLEQASNPAINREVSAFTTAQNEWHILCYDFTGAPATLNRLVFLFDLGTPPPACPNVSSTFYFDNIVQQSFITLPFTANSQYFCPDAAVNLTYPPGGDWYASQYSTDILYTGTTYTTPVLTAQQSYWVDPGGSTVVTAKAIGPTCGTTAFGNGLTGKQYFTSNMCDGSFFMAVQMNQHVPAGFPSGHPGTCAWTCTATNTTTGLSRTVSQTNAPTAGNTDLKTFNFNLNAVGGSLPINFGDQVEVEFISNSGHPCYTTIGTGCTYSQHVPFPSTVSPEITFTRADHNGSNAGNNFIGVNYWIEGCLPTPRVQINAIVACPLQINLIRFTAKEDQGNAKLNWATASEKDNDYFIVRKTKDGINFRDIGKVKGAGSASYLNQYSFIDTDLEQGVTYYQIIQVDFDGGQTESWLVAVDKIISHSYGVYPNPTEGIFTVSKTIDLSEEIEIEIKDITGRTVDHYKIYGKKPLLKENFNINDYPSGVFTLIISTRNQVNVIKLIKQ